MAMDETGKLVKLSDSAQTVANPDEDIRDRNVKDKDGEDLGRVNDLLIDDVQNKVRFMEVGSGGFLGLGEHKSFIPIDAITRIDEDVHIDQTREYVAKAPAYDPDLVDQSSYYEDVYGYYGYPPYWGATYTYPGFPYYPAKPA